MTKTGMLGIGEKEDEVYQLMDDVRSWSNADIITVGQCNPPKPPSHRSLGPS